MQNDNINTTPFYKQKPFADLDRSHQTKSYQRETHSPFYSNQKKLSQKKPSSSSIKKPYFHGAHLQFQDSQQQKNYMSLPNLSATKKPTDVKKWVTAKDYCQKAQELLNQRQWKSAQTVLQKGLVEVAKTAQAYHLLGLAFYHQGLFQKALLQIEKACDEDPKPEYFLNLSLVLNEIGQYKSAQKAYETAKRIKSQTAEQNWRELITKRHNQTAQAYLKNHQFKPALKEYIKGLEYYPQISTKLQIARLLWKLNQKKVAQKYLQAFITLHPNNITAHLLLATWYFEQEQIPQAVHEWETVLRIDPKNQSAYNYLLKVQQISEWN